MDWTQPMSGSKAFPYQETLKVDGKRPKDAELEILSLHAITAMPQYEAKSFEELRLEDYVIGNEGCQSRDHAPTNGSGQRPTEDASLHQGESPLGTQMFSPLVGAASKVAGSLGGNGAKGLKMGSHGQAPVTNPSYHSPKKPRVPMTSPSFQSLSKDTDSSHMKVSNIWNNSDILSPSFACVFVLGR